MTNTILDVRHLTIAFKDESNPKARPNAAVRDVSFTIAGGTCTALVGESGSGKSLTARAVISLLPPSASVLEGDIRLEGESVVGLDEYALSQLRGKKAGIIFQDPLEALNPLHRIGKQLFEAIAIHNPALARNKKALRERAIELLESVELDHPEERLEAYPHELSGGQRQRVVIAIAIANDPALLIADEPTTALDANLQAAVLALLLKLARQKNIALLLISHDLALVREAADVMHVMRRGRIVESLKPTDRPTHPYSKLLLEGADERFREDEIREVNPELALALRAGTLTKVLEAKDIRVLYKRQTKGFFSRAVDFNALTLADVHVAQGETLAVIGESGSGKSTLALALLRLIPSQGTILLTGKRLDGLSFNELRPIRRLIQPVFQDPYASLNPRLSIRDLIAEGLVAQGRFKSSDDCAALVRDNLRAVGLPEAYERRFPHELSGGERQRVSIARALILEPSLLILDEPTSALDRALQFQVMHLLKKLQSERGLATIFITHDLSLVKGFATRVMVLEKGRLVEEGMTKDLLTHPASEALRSLVRTARLAPTPLSSDQKDA